MFCYCVLYYALAHTDYSFLFFLKKTFNHSFYSIDDLIRKISRIFFFYYEGFYAKNKNKAVPLMVSKLVCLLEFGRPFLKMHILGHMSIDCISSGVWQVLV